MAIYTLGVLNSPTSLRIFDRFQIDYSLPKWVKIEDGLDDETQVRSSFKSNSMNIVDISINEGGMTISQSFNGEKNPNSAWRTFCTLFQRKPPKLKAPTATQVQYVFTQCLKSAEELKIFEEREDAWQVFYDRAKAAGQKTLLEQLDRERDIRQFENQMFSLGMKKYLTEQQLLKFSAELVRGLCLDWIGNFVRPIPETVVAKKVRCDELGLFDNYVILHFDPENRGTSEKDREIAKDPILFGVMSGSRKLYFVGDWIDEQCDLTFQQIVDTLGTPLELT